MEELRKQDVVSCETFITKLKNGETVIDSILFTGSVSEILLIKRLCRYYDITYKEQIKKDARRRGYIGKKYLVCYKIEY